MNAAIPAGRAARAAAVLLVLGAGLAAPAFAEAEPRIQAQRAVRYADLDLSGEAGRATLRRRVAQAAESVCGSPPFGAVHRWADHRACVKAAKAAAQPKVEATIAAATAAGMERASLR